MTDGSNRRNPFGTRAALQAAEHTYIYYDLAALNGSGVSLDRMPITIKILLENVVRQCSENEALDNVAGQLARWSPDQVDEYEFPYLPSRVILQDFTGVPTVVDLAAMRSAVARMGGDPLRINPLVPVDLVIDHSVQVDSFGSTLAFERNVEREYERNHERYALLRWAQQSFDHFRVVPPGTGIVHQVNLEYLATVVASREIDGELVAFPDTLVGTDSHTTMVNGLGVLGWGAGGIEAEANLLGQPMYMPKPIVVGFHMLGQIREGVTATDLVLTVTEMLRKHGVVGKFVEFYGTGLSDLSVADRATLSNMAPEYGATSSLFPVDEQALRYLRMTGRDQDRLELVEKYCRAQGMFRTGDSLAPVFSETLELDLASVEPSLAGPRRPQDRVAVRNLRENFRDAFTQKFSDSLPDGSTVEVDVNDERVNVGDGSVVIAAITSCTNTSNPSVMLAAGLIAKKAVERGLRVSPAVKTSMAPGSRVVTDYLDRAGLMPYLEALRFHVVGYGCTTCIGNSGPLADPVAQAVDENELVVCSVLSGNRNFEGRIHPQVRASYLASPPLVVAYALAGTVDIDLDTEPLGQDPNDQPVYLKDLWPSREEILATVESSLSPEMFTASYGHVFEGDDRWRALPIPESALYDWKADSTYVQEPPFFKDISPTPSPIHEITGARALAIVGDSVTTDHISPAGSFGPSSPAGQYLIGEGVEQRDFNSYGARRGNDRVMVRGTFANIRLRNELAGGQEGYWTTHQPDGEVMTIFDAANVYRQSGTPLLVVAGKEYGSGSSRDWAAKGPLLLGVRIVIAESFERIHRSNLIGMGILPLQFEPGQSRQTLGLHGMEEFETIGLSDALQPRQRIRIGYRSSDGRVGEFFTLVRIDTDIEVEYYRHGGVLQYVLRQLAAHDTAG